jgi:DNA-binding Lrp family transcriptional regulator
MMMTQDEILEELQKALDSADSPDDAFTTGELAEMLNLGDAAVRNRLRKLTASGRIQPIRIKRMSLTGTMRKVWGYRFISEQEPEE